MISQKEINQLINKFRICSPLFIALGEEARQRILLIIAETGITGMNVSDITKKTDLSRPAVSHHLKILKDSGFISSYKKGTQNFYFVTLQKNIDIVKDLINSIEIKLNSIDPHELERDAPWLSEAGCAPKPRVRKRR
ncbi:metalloregulator ArsR/SmtB family transcription factor [Brucepastera parasyntrophica]|uniref:ArsR/SmtB family transcription factor n=1 Tax=Brucepastera parasyntrophica TaxID=2880008 RepID=UPI002108E7D4|nr:metalloregulator ArsR/SmtB family transcription factor [Brucepastera parasyntrophica]ULQ60786.1 metalloregulator ArsR/SmtB family transcription factor [Brucepastera parasyntrophica]